MKIPSQNNNIVEILALCRFSGVHPRLMEALLGHFRAIDRILAADAGALMAIGGMNTEAANKIAAAKSHLEQARQYYDQLRQRDIALVSRFDKQYPERLFELNDPPTLLYYRGALPETDKKTVAVAGSRRATNDGIGLTVEVCRRFAGAGVQVVSSLQSGIDAAAHLGSKAGNGPSFSVLDSGLDNIHPAESQALAKDIVSNGGILGEHPPHVTFTEGNLLTSNRIVAALSQAVVVTEFYNNSDKTLDLLKCCSQIGKLAFILIDPRHGALIDEKSLSKAYSYGAIAMVGLDKVRDIIDSLV